MHTTKDYPKGQNSQCFFGFSFLSFMQICYSDQISGARSVFFLFFCHQRWMNGIWQMKVKKKNKAFYPLDLYCCWHVDHRLNASVSFRYWRGRGNRFFCIVFMVSWWHTGGTQISETLKSTFMWLSMFGQLLSMLPMASSLTHPLCTTSQQQW